MSHTISIARSSPLRFLKSLVEIEEFRLLRDPFYFSSGIEGLHSPLALPDMEKAVEFLGQAVRSDGMIYVLGDRDVDGVSSAALIGGFLQRFCDDSRLRVRVSDDGEDYGLDGGILTAMLQEKPALVILLDMGTSNGPEIERLFDAGISVIVLDHHLLHMRIPEPAHCAFVNPMRLSDASVCGEHGGKIATVGLAFKLLMAYALAQTKEWNTYYYVPDAPDNQAALTGEGNLYRLGLHLGSFATKEQASDYAMQQATDSASDLHFQCLESDVALRLRSRVSSVSNMDVVNDTVAPEAAEPDVGDCKSPETESPMQIRLGQILLSDQISSRPRLKNFIRENADLAALGLVTDMVPLVGENRILTRLGMGLSGFEDVGTAPPFRPGYEALIRQLKLPNGSLLSRDLGWSLGPAVNAAGRMGKTFVALNLLMSRDETDARERAKELVKLNEERKERTNRNEGIVQTYLEEHPIPDHLPLVYCYHADLESGVSGIMATRLTERYRRPAVYINPEGTFAKGSVRSYDGENVLELLDRVGGLLVQFGGHKEAAGFSIRYEDLPRLETDICAAAVDLFSESFEATKTQTNESFNYHVDLSPRELHAGLLKELELLEPFGPGNPEPIMRLRDVSFEQLKLMSDGKHARFRLMGNGRGPDFVAWGKGALMKDIKPGSRVDIYGCLERNFFRGVERPQFRVENIAVRSMGAN